MKPIKFSVLACALLLVPGSFAKAQEANVILKKMDEVLYSSKDMKENLKIVLTYKAGKQKTREATVLQKGTDKRLFRFTAPASQDGISTLSLPKDVMYLYLPSYGKERRISSSVKNQKFAGTDFSYEDMEAKPFTEKYALKSVKTENDTYILELIPKSPKSQYSKIIMTVNKTYYYPVHADYYDKGNNKIKEASYEFEKISGYWTATVIEMTDLRKRHTTKMIISNIQFDTGLSDDEFTVRKLKQ